MAKNTVGSLNYQIYLDDTKLRRSIARIPSELGTLNRGFKTLQNPIRQVTTDIRQLDKMWSEGAFLRDGVSAQEAEKEYKGLRRGLMRHLRGQLRLREETRQKEIQKRKANSQAINAELVKRGTMYERFWAKMQRGFQGGGAGGAGGGGANRAMAGGIAQFLGAGPKIQGITRLVGSLGAAFVGVGAAIAGASVSLNLMMGTVSKMKDLIAFVIKAGDDWNKQQLTLGARLGGNTLLAGAYLEQLTKYAQVTPYNTEQMAQFSNQLLSTGMAASKVVPSIKLLGDLAAGDAYRFQLLAKALGDVEAAGRLLGPEVKQFTNANVNIRKAIADMYFDGNMMKMLEAMQDGAISAEMVRKALEGWADATNASEMMKAINEGTISGQWASLNEEIKEQARLLGEDIAPEIAKIIQQVRKLFDSVQDIRVLLDKDGLVASLQLIFDKVKGISLMFGETGRKVYQLGQFISSLVDRLRGSSAEDTLEEVQARLKAEREILEEKQKQAIADQAAADAAAAARKEAEEELSKEIEERKENAKKEQERIKGLIEAEEFRWRVAHEGEMFAYEAAQKRLVTEKKITEEQAKANMEKYKAYLDMKNLADEEEAAKKQKEEEEKKKVEDLRKRAEDLRKRASKFDPDENKKNEQVANDKIKKIEDEAKKKIEQYGKGTQLGASFGAGSRGEFEFRAAAIRRARADSFAKRVHKEAQDKRQLILEELQKKNKRDEKRADELDLQANVIELLGV